MYFRLYVCSVVEISIKETRLTTTLVFFFFFGPLWLLNGTRVYKPLSMKKKLKYY